MERENLFDEVDAFLNSDLFNREEALKQADLVVRALLSEVLRLNELLEDGAVFSDDARLQRSAATEDASRIRRLLGILKVG
jgi:hypothetical protein